MKTETKNLLKKLNREQPVCVTGASGYVASWIVRYLLELGLTVHATVRDPSKKSAVAHLLKAAEGQPGVLRLFKADLLKEGSYDEAIQGCAVVIHTASPFLVRGFKDANEALVKPAVMGTENVLNSCNRIESVTRVVLTSSVASVFGDNIDILKTPEGIFNEGHWNITSSVSHQPYPFSKVQAEKKAWAMQGAQSRWSLVTINPGLVMGPSLTQLSQSTSMDVMRDLGNGAQRTGVPNLEFGLVDVRDVAEAHILAAFQPKAEGRFIVNAETISLLRMASILRLRYPKYPLPFMEVPKWVVRWVAPVMAGLSMKYIDLNVGYPIAFDNSRSQKLLGLSYRSVSQTLWEHFAQMIEDGMLKAR